MNEAPQALDHAGIARRIPHQGRMCLLDRLQSWSADAITCTATSHRAGDNPLRSASGLQSACAVEYAAQAMALHGALLDAGGVQGPGYLASARQVRLHVPLLDRIEGPLVVHARRQAGDAQQILYGFTVSDEGGRPVAEGRATVVLSTGLAEPAP